MRLIIDGTYNVHWQLVSKHSEMIWALDTVLTFAFKHPQKALDTFEITPLFILLARVVIHVEFDVENAFKKRATSKQIEAAVWHECFNELQQQFPDSWSEEYRAQLPRVKHA